MYLFIKKIVIEKKTKNNLSSGENTKSFRFGGWGATPQDYQKKIL